MAADNKALDHAWSYFALHASQRITVFNYFVVFAGVLCTGMATAIQASPQLALVGSALGLLLIFLSYVFWKIDQRTAFLIKHAEDVIKQLEPSTAPLFAGEEGKTHVAKRDMRMWTYGRAFRTIFAVMGTIGFAGAVLGDLRATGILDWGSVKVASTSQATPTGLTGSGGPSHPGACGNHCTVRKPIPPCDRKTSNLTC
jgi:hypothetical protein